MADPVTYTAVLPISRPTVERVAVLLHAHRRALRTRSRRRSLGCFNQAVLFCRWMLQATRVRQLAIDHHLSLATTYRYLAEVLGVLAEQAPGLRGALLAAKIAGYRYVMLDGTLIPTDRCSAPGPTKGVDLWWSGKHHRHGGNIQVLTAPDGWPLCVSPVRPGREHDVTCARTHPELLKAVDEFSVEGRFVLADLGYEGEDRRLATPYKQMSIPKRKGSTKRKKLPLTEAQKVINTMHARLRSRAEQGNARLKVTFEAVRHVSLDPWRIGTIAAAALVLLHWEHDRTT